VTAFLALWNDLERGREPEYDEWHTREHVPERVAAPGFLSGRRYVNRAHPVHRYFTFYEAAGMEAFHTPQYLDLLNNPTPWSASMRPSFRNFLRAPCTLERMAGHGMGAALAVLRVRLADAATPPDLSGLLGEPGIVAARLGRHVPGTPTVPWRSGAPGPGAEDPFDAVLVLDALDRGTADRGFTRARALFEAQGEPDAAGGTYDLAFVFPGADATERAAHRRPAWDPE
jgi:hypothetical protein